jgi:hypothetical protein
MFFRMSILCLSISRSSLAITPTMCLGVLLCAGERSEPSATARPDTFEPSRNWPRRANVIALCLFSAFLASAGENTSASFQGTLVVHASSSCPWTAPGQSGAQLEPRALCDLNSNRCLSRGLGHELACIRMSLNTFSGCVTK